MKEVLGCFFCRGVCFGDCCVCQELLFVRDCCLSGISVCQGLLFVRTFFAKDESTVRVSPLIFCVSFAYLLVSVGTDDGRGQCSASVAKGTVYTSGSTYFGNGGVLVKNVPKFDVQVLVHRELRGRKIRRSDSVVAKGGVLLQRHCPTGGVFAGIERRHCGAKRYTRSNCLEASFVATLVLPCIHFFERE